METGGGRGQGDHRPEHLDLYKEYHTDGTLDPYMSCRNVFLENWNSEVMMVRIYNNLSSWERSASPRQFSGYESMGATQQLVERSA